METFKGLCVLLPNAETIAVDEKGSLPLSDKLSKKKKTALQSSSLISIGQLCGDNCNVLLIKQTLYAVKDAELVLEGTRNLNDHLWDIPVQRKTVASDNYATPPIYPDLHSA